MSHLVLHPGPRLVYHHWNSRGDNPGWMERDVTAAAIEYLFETVHLADEVTLADVFQLFELSPLLKQVHRRNRAYELCAEALKGVSADFVPGYGPDAIEYLELYQVWGFNSHEAHFEGHHRWDFHGVGYELRGDPESAGSTAGQRVHWGVSTARIGTLLALPLRVKLTVPVCEEDPDSNANGHTLYTATVDAPTLGQLLDGIVWELSFYGVPGTLESEDVQLDGGASDEESASADEGCNASTAPFSVENMFTESDSSVVEQFFESTGRHSAGAVTLALHRIDNELPAQAALQAVLGQELVLRADHRALTAYQLRRALRLAGEGGPSAA